MPNNFRRDPRPLKPAQRTSTQFIKSRLKKLANIAKKRAKQGFVEPKYKNVIMRGFQGSRMPTFRKRKRTIWDLMRKLAKRRQKI